MTRPRIILFHAIVEAMRPVHEALAASWPASESFDLFDSSLAPDLAAEGGTVLPAMIDRFITLSEYAASNVVAGRRASAILFTCSAFGPAIDAVRARLPIPVVKPNEAAFEEAIAAGPAITIVVTFGPSAAPMLAELHAMMRTAGVTTDRVRTHVVPGAFDAMKAGRLDEHDRLIAASVARLPVADAVVLGQFSMARAAADVRNASRANILTTPESAVRKLKMLVEQRPGK
jgi:Asp/Glu/hydantoin racemase